eukprot:3712934-Pyramimonas_sp.AAC.1
MERANTHGKQNQQTNAFRIGYEARTGNKHSDGSGTQLSGRSGHIGTRDSGRVPEKNKTPICGA